MLCCHTFSKIMFVLCFPADVIITIRSTKDNELTFNAPWTSQNPVITVYIPEEEPAATLVTRVIATDPEMGVQVRDYRKVFGSDPQSFFTLDHQTGQQIVFSVSVKYLKIS